MTWEALSAFNANIDQSLKACRLLLHFTPSGHLKETLLNSFWGEKNENFNYSWQNVGIKSNTVHDLDNFSYIKTTKISPKPSTNNFKCICAVFVRQEKVQFATVLNGNLCFYFSLPLPTPQFSLEKLKLAAKDGKMRENFNSLCCIA